MAISIARPALQKAIGAFRNPWFLSFLGTALLDVILTAVALNAGMVEANPIYKFMGAWGIIGVRMFLTVLLGEWCILKNKMDALKMGVGANAAIVYSNLLRLVLYVTAG